MDSALERHCLVESQPTSPKILVCRPIGCKYRGLAGNFLYFLRGQKERKITSNINGSVAERTNAPVLKTGVLARVPEVRILPLPFMQINDYQFGSIMIDGKNYSHDIEACPDGGILPWWRKESHIIDTDDVKRAIGQKPELIIIGNGYSGVAKITKNAEKEIESSGIQLIIEKTGDAAKTFNAKNQTGSKKIIGLFHLTC